MLERTFTPGVLGSVEIALQTQKDRYMQDITELLGQVVTMSHLVRRRIAKALAAESLEEARETMVEALEGLDTMIELASSANLGDTGGDDT